MNQAKEKLKLARISVQTLIAQQEEIITDLVADLGLKNTSETLARHYICRQTDEVWLDKTLEQLLFLLSESDS